MQGDSVSVFILICYLEIKTLYPLEPLFLFYFSALKRST
jgi:hypothetical protein